MNRMLYVRYSKTNILEFSEVARKIYFDLIKYGELTITMPCSWDNIYRTRLAQIIEVAINKYTEHTITDTAIVRFRHDENKQLDYWKISSLFRKGLSIKWLQ